MTIVQNVKKFLRIKLMSNNINPVQCGCGGQAEIRYIYPYWHLTDEWQAQVSCKKCNIQTSYYKDEDKKEAEFKAIMAWNEAMNKKRYCYNCTNLENSRYCSLYGLQVELGMNCDNWTDNNAKHFIDKVDTVNVLEHNASIIVDGYKYQRSEYLCGNCKKKVLGGDDYCSHCGTKLDWTNL